MLRDYALDLVVVEVVCTLFPFYGCGAAIGHYNASERILCERIEPWSW